jgi:hypothetical protein
MIVFEAVSFFVPAIRSRKSKISNANASIVILGISEAQIETGAGGRFLIAIDQRQEYFI